MTKRLDIFFPLFVRDFLTSTIGWTAAERGHYLTLLMIQWDRGGLPDDLDDLERFSAGVGGAWKLLEPKFPVGPDGQRRNPRLEEHRANAIEVAEKRSKAGSAAANRRWKNGGCDSHGKRNATASAPQDDGTASGRVASAGAGAGGRRGTAKTAQPPKGEKMGNVAMPVASDAHANRISNGCHPQPQPQEKNTHFVCVSSARSDTHTPGVELHSTWEAFRQAWNATPNTKRFDALGCPSEALGLVTDPAFLAAYPAALERLGRSTFFVDPAALTWFIRNWSRVLAGEFDGRSARGRGSTGPRKIFQLEDGGGDGVAIEPAGGAA